MKIVSRLLFVLVVPCLLTACSRTSNVDPAVGKVLAAAQKLNGCPSFSGRALWANEVRFTVAGEPVKDLANGAVRSVFDAKGIATTAADIDMVCAFISQAAGAATELKGKSIDLRDVLSRMKKAP